jgi:DNA gyrase subunit A
MSPKDLASEEPSRKTFEEIFEEDYLTYAMSVIVSRALPDIRDGMKPVHRRIMYVMDKDGFVSSRAHQKSAKIVGNVMGGFHPHGDSAIYDTLVRLAQSFAMRQCLVDGQGNFGSIDGDPAAAMRYTESRMTKAAHDIVRDIDMGTVDWAPTYDGLTLEPKVLPTRLPNIIINGSAGIAVGMATKMPTHNPREAIEACLVVLNNPQATLDDVMEVMPGPDFPTGGVIMGRSGIRQAYETGRGSFTVVGEWEIEETSDGKSQIIVTALPYETNKASFVEKIAEVVASKKIEGITDLADQSDRNSLVRVVIELGRGVDPLTVLNRLKMYTQLKTSFPVNSVCLDARGRPIVAPLLEQIRAFNEHREQVVRRRTIFLLDKARRQLHQQIGLYAAVTRIDDVVATIRGSGDVDVARARLMEMDFPTEGGFATLLVRADPDLEEAPETFKLDASQVEVILKMALRQLTGLEREKIENLALDLSAEIQNALTILNDRNVLIGIVRTELEEMAVKHDSPRQTRIEHSEMEILSDEDLIERRDIVLTLTNGGYVKRTMLEAYREQKRGGKGKSGMDTKDGDYVTTAVSCSTHSPLIFFTSRGMAHTLKAYRLPDAPANARGRSMANYLPMQAADGESVTSVIALPQDMDELQGMSMLFVTDFGNIRRTDAVDMARINRRGKIAMKLEDEDGTSLGSLVNVILCNDDDQVLLATRNGHGVRIRVGDLRVTISRGSIGVRGVRLAKDDKIISATLLRDPGTTDDERHAYLAGGSCTLGDENNPREVTLSADRMEQMRQAEEFILTLSERGFAKRTSAYAFRTIARGGKGVSCMDLNETTGKLIACFPVEDDDGLLLVTPSGQTIRIPVSSTRIQRRKTRGLRLFNLKEDENIVAAARLEAGDTPEEPDVEAPPEELEEE